MEFRGLGDFVGLGVVVLGSGGGEVYGGVKNFDKIDRFRSQIAQPVDNSQA